MVKMKISIVLSVVSVLIGLCLALPANKDDLPPGGLVKINCTRPNEYYNCGSACQTECATLGQPCLIFNIRCNDACYCKNGYARNSKGECIPIPQC